MKQFFNPWHHIEAKTDKSDVVNSYIEISRGSKAKYELEKETGLLILDRVLFSALTYPANYGFIPQTYCDDKDPLDILVISQVDMIPGCLVNAKVIGVMKMIDNGEGDDKLIAVAAGDPAYKHINDISELPPHILGEIKGFFEDYKKLEKKTVEINGILGKEDAMRILEESFVLYDENIREK